MRIEKAASFSGIIAFAAVIMFAMVSCESPTDPPKLTAVNIAAIGGVTVPAAGGTPVTAITPTAQYSGTVTWNGNPSAFAALTAYTATITLTAKDGFTLQGVTADFFTVAGAATVSNAAHSGVITAVFPQTGGTADNPAVISITAIQGVTAPVTGATPVTAITPTVQYSGTVTWNDNPHTGSVTTFAADTQYIATITLTAETGYTLQGIGANYFTVANAIFAGNDANSGVITVVFPKTGGTAENPTIIDIAAIQGVTAPAIGGIPVTSIAGNAQYSGTVTWNNNPSSFAASTVYTATITLKAKTGYTLQGVAANFFTVAGAASVSNSANSGVITAEFPATALTSTTSINISIIAPVKGETPDTTASGEGHFTIGTVSWLPPDTDSFLGDTVYTAVVTLTAHSGHTFAGLSSATVNGQSAAVSNNTGSTVTLSCTFPPTNTKTVSGIAVKTQPTKLIYTHGDTLDLAGLVITLIHDDATTEDVAAAHFTEKNITATPAQGDNLAYSSTHNGQPVKITYGRLTCNTASNLIINRAAPIADDFYIGGIGTVTYNGSARTVTITPQAEKSDGYITVKYNGIPTAPAAAGIYTVTFDIAAAGDFDAASGLSAGTLTIENATPTAADFDISGTGTFTYNGNSRAVTITPQTGKSDGAITVKYNGITTAPSAAGIYTVTFDVAAATNYNAAPGLSAGILTIGKAAVTADDFDISGTGTFYYEGNTTRAVTITPKTGKSDGNITVKYNGIPAAPSAIGTYAVTFDVAATANFDAAPGLSAGTLTINVQTFTSIADLRTYLNSRPANDVGSPYLAVLTVNDLGGAASASGSLGNALTANNTKYVNIDLSGSNLTSIPLNSFNTCTSLVGITLPNVTSIGNSAFSGCANLTGIIIPNSVTSVGTGVFDNCNNLRNITIKTNRVTNTNTLNWGHRFPASNLVVTFEDVTSTGDYAFYGCARLVSLTIGQGVTTIGNYAFYNCNMLPDVTIGNNVTTIGNAAFMRCTSLTGITIPNSVTRIETGAFQDCTGFTSVTIPNSVIYLSGFSQCTNLTSVTIGNKVTTIGSYAFHNCKKLTGVTIPNSVTTIEDHAFYGCGNLAGITIPNSVTSIGDYAFWECRNEFGISLGDLTIPDSVESIGDYAFGGNYLTGLTIGNSVKTIGVAAFYLNSFTGPLTIPDSVTKIGDWAFDNCYNLTGVTIGNGVTSVWSNAFDGCRSLTEINVTAANTAYSSADGVLYNKDKTILTAYPQGKTNSSFTIPNSVTVIAYGAFAYCKLTSVTIPNSVTGFGYFAFFYSSLANVTIPDSVKTIGAVAFGYCYNLTSITIPNSVTTMYGGAFYGCDKLATVIIGNGLSSIDTYRPSTLEYPLHSTNYDYGAFGRCASLTNLTIGSNVKTIGVSAFSECTSLVSVTIPNSVTSIGNIAFQDCTSLTGVTIGSGVKNIEPGAFSRCASLASVTIPASVTSIGNYAFDGCTSLTSVTFQCTITSGNYGYEPFLGDLGDKYFASSGGGTGTYKTTAPVNRYSTWTKQ